MEFRTGNPQETTPGASTQSRPIDQALEYAEAGWPVFPCTPGKKRPATDSGFYDATTDADQVIRWWDAMPYANIGIRTGAPGPDVLDVDTKHGEPGLETLDRLRQLGLVDGAERRVRTPSAGWHLYFAGSDQRSSRLGRFGLDFKAQGGYVLAPPSIVDGNSYKLSEQWDIEPLELRWSTICDVLEPPRLQRSKRQPTSTNLGALGGWVSNLQPGNRNSGLFWAACRAAEAGLDPYGLVGPALGTGLSEAEARRTIGSALRRAKPTAKPEEERNNDNSGSEQINDRH